MKFTQNNSIYKSQSYFLEIEGFWRKTAMEISMKHGVLVDVDMVWNPAGNFPQAEEIVFVIGDNRFGSLLDLEQALKSKAFL